MRNIKAENMNIYECNKLTWNFDYSFNNKQHSTTRNVIYKIENALSGKVYIGQTKRELKKRWSDYKYDLLKPIQVDKRYGSNIKLKRSVQKYYKKTGDVSFLKFSILEVLDCENLLQEQIDKILCERERYHILEHRNIHGNKVCNVLDGAVVRSFTDTGRNNISKAKKDFYKTEKGIKLKKKLRSIRLGTKASDETKAILSKSHKGLFSGEKHPLYGKKGELNPMFGKNHSENAITKMKQNRKGKAAGLRNHNTKIYDLYSNPLISPRGEVYEQIVCLNAFCKQFGLHTTHLRNVIKGKNKTHKGWSLKSNMCISHL